MTLWQGCGKEVASSVSRRLGRSAHVPPRRAPAPPSLSRDAAPDRLRPSAGTGSTWAGWIGTDDAATPTTPDPPRLSLIGSGGVRARPGLENALVERRGLAVFAEAIEGALAPSACG